MLWPTLLFSPLLYRRFFLPLLHKFLAALLLGIAYRAFRPDGIFKNRFMCWGSGLGADVGVPRFDPHSLHGILCGGLLCWKIQGKVIRRGAAHIDMGLQSPSPDFFLALCQLFHPVGRLLCGRPSGSLGTVSLSVLPPPSLIGIPDLVMQLFCSCEKSAPKQFHRRGLNLFFCTF